MEKLIELLRERNPNFDGNHILDMMYSEGTIYIKDGKPVYVYDSIIGPGTERMIINFKIGFIERLVLHNNIDRDKILEEDGLFRHYFYDLDYIKNYYKLVMWLSVEDKPIDLLCKLLK